MPFRDSEGNVYQTAMAPLVGFVDARGSQREIVAVLGVDLPVEFLDVFHDFRRMTVLLTALAIGLTMKRNYSMAAYYASLLNQYHPGNPEVHNLLGLALMNKPGATF